METECNQTNFIKTYFQLSECLSRSIHYVFCVVKN